MLCNIAMLTYFVVMIPDCNPMLCMYHVNTPLGSMLFTVGTYSMFFGLPYASGMVGLILVHEIGHAAVMHARGVPFSPMVFIPFMGAVIATKELPRDAWEDALIAFGGPVLGSLGAGAVGLAGHATNSQLLITLADFGLVINLFNLLPLESMDGGRMNRISLLLVL